MDDNSMERYLTVGEAARRLDRSIEQVRRYLREGRLAGQRIGQQWFIEKDAVAAWRPGRSGEGRVSEAVATYEVSAMKTDDTKQNASLILNEWFRKIDEIAEKIQMEDGDFDVVEALRRDREEH